MFCSIPGVLYNRVPWAVHQIQFLHAVTPRIRIIFFLFKPILSGLDIDVKIVILKGSTQELIVQLTLAS